MQQLAHLRTGLETEYSPSDLEPRGGGGLPTSRQASLQRPPPPSSSLTAPSAWPCPSSQVVGERLKCPPGRDKYQTATGSWNSVSDLQME